MGNGGDERKVAKEVKTSKTRRFARTKRTKRARFRPTNERRADARAYEILRKKQTGERKRREGGIFFKTNRSVGHGASPCFRFFSTTSHDPSIFYRWDLTKEKEENDD